RSSIARPGGIVLLTRTNALVREVQQGFAIVCQQDSAFRCRPCQNLWIGRARQPDLLNAKDVDRGNPALKPADNIGVEILVTEERQHRAAPSPWRGPTESLAGFHGAAGRPRSSFGADPPLRRVPGGTRRTEQDSPGSS